MKKSIFLLVLAIIVLGSCYKDQGTSEKDYKEINELTIEGINDQYARDVDDSLKISPQLIGTQYSDTSKFNYAWEIDNKIVSNDLDLNIKVDFLPGNKISRFIVEDKATHIKKYVRFALNVSSSTAGNLIMVLSKSKGKAELSYLRLDKPANWAVNYFESRYGYALGTNPQELNFLLVEASRIQCYPFVNGFGRVLVMADNKVNLIDKRTLAPDATTYLTGEAYTGVSSYPPPNTEGYKPEFFTEGISIWRSNAYGTGFQAMTEFQMISGGALYFATLAPSIWTPSFYFNKKSVYGTNGYFSAFGFYDGMIPTANNNLFQHGYTLGNFVVFDKVYGRFAYSSYGSSYAIPTTDVKEFPGHDLVYGSATSQSGTSFAVLKAPDNSARFLLLGKTGTKYSIAGEISGGVATPSSHFYNMKTSPYTFFTSGNKIYKYNILDIKTNSVPSENNAVLSLTSLGYAADAVITSMTVSRTENSLIVGVSRYGNDTNGNGEENKGDILVFDLDKVSLNLTLRNKYEGVSGIPVDVKIKYQTHWRDGKSNGGTTVLDNI
ncbi:MAG: hypothetical protein E6Q89_00080 [Bacteroidia bacterium]|nr:MAG: hypothetical protein E6Q89_00080 [Bacteroidia bacterium]